MVKTSSTIVSKSDEIRAVIAAHPSATRREIKARLRARKIKVSDALVSKVLADHRSQRRKRAPSNGHNGASKADAIRHMFEQMGRDARPRDVIAALKGRGITVTSAQVSTLRRKLDLNPTQGSPSTNHVSLEHLLAAKHLAERLGGIANARQALDSLARLVDA